MYPNLLRLAWFEITSYSALLALSFGVGALVAARRAKTRGIDPVHIIRLSACILIAAIVGSRLAFALVNYEAFAHNLFSIYHDGIFEIAGLVMNGGVLLSLATVWAFAAALRLPLLRIMDVLAPSFALGVSMTRVGCFLNGCCFGRATDLPVGVVFPAYTPAGQYQRADPAGLAPIHPTQVYCALCGLAILFALLVFEKKWKRKLNFSDGATAFLALAFYGAARFAVEFLRFNGDGLDLPLGWSHNQYTSIVLFLAGAAGMVFLRVRSRLDGSVVPIRAA